MTAQQPAAWGVRAEPPKGVEKTQPRVPNVGENGSGNGTGGQPPRRVSGRAAARQRARRCSRMRTAASQADAQGRSHRTARRRGVARGRRSRQGRARRSLRRAWRAVPAQGEHDGGGTAVAAQHAAAAKRRAKRSAERAQRTEARGIPARRAKTAKRAWQGSPVAKRRARTQNTKRRQRSDDRKYRRKDLEIVGLPKPKKLPVQASGGAAAAERAAGGGSLGEGANASQGGVPKKTGPHRALAMRPGGKAPVRAGRAGRGCRARRPCPAGSRRCPSPGTRSRPWAAG